MTSAVARSGIGAGHDWPERVALTLLVVAAFGVVLRSCAGVGCDAVGGRPTYIPRPLSLRFHRNWTEAPRRGPGPAVRAVPARYLGATRSGDWLDRVVVHGLGVPSAAEVTVGPRRVWVLRDGAPDIFVASDQVVTRSARPRDCRAGLEKDGVLVITWRHGDQLLDLGLRVRDPGAAEAVRAGRRAARATPAVETPAVATPAVETSRATDQRVPRRPPPSGDTA